MENTTKNHYDCEKARSRKLRYKSLEYALTHNNFANVIEVAQAYEKFLVGKQWVILGPTDSVNDLYDIAAIRFAKLHNTDYKTTIEIAERYYEYMLEGTIPDLSHLA